LSCQAVRDCLGDPTFKELEEEEVWALIRLKQCLTKYIGWWRTRYP
jgi:hypothetical protein